MAGFTFRVSGGVTGIRPAATPSVLDRAPFLLMEDPSESLTEEATKLETEGIIFLRANDAADDVHPTNSRAIIKVLNPFGSHEPRDEGAGNTKFALYTNGVQEFAPGPSNRIYMSPVSTFRTSQNALVYSGLAAPLATPSQVANAYVDMMYIPGIRLPGVASIGGEGLIPCPVNTSGTPHPEVKFGAAGSFGFQSRWWGGAERNSTSGATETSGVLIPAGAFLMAVGYDIQVRGHTDSADAFDLGISGALTRFGTGLNTYSYDDDVIHDEANPFKYYGADTAIVITLDNSLTVGQFFRINLWTCYLTFMSGTLLIPA